MALPEGNVNSEDTLIIPLTTVIKNLRYEAKFNIVRIVIVLASLSLPKVLYNLNPSLGWNTALVYSGIFYIFMPFIMISNMRTARKTLYLYENGAPDVMILNSQGLEFPVALLTDDSRKQDLLNTGRVTIKLPWGDITRWYVFNQSKSTPACHALIIKNAIPTPGGEYVSVDSINLQRNFSKEEERLFLDFAQRFLSIKIQKPWFF